MIIAQSIIITPIVLALSRQVIEDLNNEYSNFSITKNFKITNYKDIDLGRTLHINYCGLSRFGRGIAEVGAVIIVGAT